MLARPLGLLVAGSAFLILGSGCGSRSAKPLGSAAPPWAVSQPKNGLTTAARTVTGTCAFLAAQARSQHIGLRVFCPPLVPAVLPITRETAGGTLRYHQMRDGYQASFFALKVHWAYRWGGHWTFGASRDGGLSVYIHVKPFGALRPRYERTVIGGRAATVFLIPQKLQVFYAGHVGVVWNQRGSTYDVTVHGHAWRSRVIAMARALMSEIDACASPAASTTQPCDGLVFG